MVGAQPASSAMVISLQYVSDRLLQGLKIEGGRPESNIFVDGSRGRVTTYAVLAPVLRLNRPPAASQNEGNRSVANYHFGNFPPTSTQLTQGIGPPN
jgi:hypothetical protein